MNLKKQAANRLIFVLSFFLIAGCKPVTPQSNLKKSAGLMAFIYAV